MMNQIIVNNALVLTNVQKFEGHNTEMYTAKMNVNGEKVNVTYDCKGDNVIIHEWYKIEKDTLDIIIELVRNCLKCAMVEELYPAAVEAMDRYNKAIGMGFPESYIEGLEFNMNNLLKKIEGAGVLDDFIEYACVG